MPGVAETTHNLVPVCETFIEDCETPVSAFLKLRGSGPAFLLESAEQGQRVGRWSFIGYKPRKVLRWTLADGGDPYAIAAAEIAQYRQAPIEEPIPFTGGAVGFFGYDCVRAVERLPDVNPDPVGLPDMALMLSDVIVAFDHLKHTVTILANSYEGEDARERIREVRERLAGPLPHPPAQASPEPEFESNMPREQFEAMVARIIEYVHAGDAFQVVPSQRWSAEVPVEPFSIYRGLRAVNPSPYMYFLDFEDFQIVGASPEPLVTVSGRAVSTRPIAGTRPRGATVDDDKAIAEELLADEKERAEHVMLVDLGRNDLGRVCEFGTVNVDSFMGVETYSHVIHIVSNVTGTLREDVSAGRRAALRAARGHAVRRPEGARHGDHRRARAGQARRLRRRRRLALLRRRPRHLHLHPHRGGQGRRRARAGGRRHGGRRQARLRVRGVARQGARRGAGDRARRAAGGLAVKVLMVDNYDSFTYNLVQYLGELGAEPVAVRNDAASVDELLERRISTAWSSRPGRARRTRPASRSRSCGASRRPACRRSASASATSRSCRRSAAPWSGTCPCTARRPRSSTTAQGSSRGCRAR